MKNKFSQLLDDYCDNLKRLGIYLLIVLFVFVLAVNVMFNRDKMVEKAMKDLSQLKSQQNPLQQKHPKKVQVNTHQHKVRKLLRYRLHQVRKLLLTILQKTEKILH